MINREIHLRNTSQGGERGKQPSEKQHQEVNRIHNDTYGICITPEAMQQWFPQEMCCSYFQELPSLLVPCRQEPAQQLWPNA